MKKSITIRDNRNGKEFEFKIKDGSIGPDVADLTSFYSKTGMFVYDPGFTSTASCSSEITYIDGEKGLLLHRGYKIEDLAENQITQRFVIYYLMENYQTYRIKKNS